MSDYFKYLESILETIQPEEHFKSSSSEAVLQQQPICFESGIRAYQLKNLIIQLVLFGNLLVKKLHAIKLPFQKKATSDDEIRDKSDNSIGKQPQIPQPHPKTPARYASSRVQHWSHLTDQSVWKTAAAFVLVSNLVLYLQGQCAVSAETNTKCNPQPPDCMPCEGTMYYHDNRNNTCEMCPFCPPGFQPDRHCPSGGHDASGRTLSCVPCGQNHFSKENDQRRCSSCQVCDNTINDIPCNATSDRQCGPCAAGFGLLHMEHKERCLPCFLLDSRTAATQESCSLQSTTPDTTTKLKLSKANSLTSTEGLPTSSAKINVVDITTNPTNILSTENNAQDEKELQSTKTNKPSTTKAHVVDRVQSTMSTNKPTPPMNENETPNAHHPEANGPSSGDIHRGQFERPSSDNKESSAKNDHLGPFHQGRNHPISEKNVTTIAILMTLIVIALIVGCICKRRMEINDRICGRAPVHGYIPTDKKRIQDSPGIQNDWDSGSSTKNGSEIQFIANSRRHDATTVCKNITFQSGSQKSTDSHDDLKQPFLTEDLDNSGSSGMITKRPKFPKSNQPTTNPKPNQGYKLKKSSEMGDSSSRLLQSFDSPATSKKGFDSPVSLPGPQPLTTIGGNLGNDFADNVYDVEGITEGHNYPFEDNDTDNTENGYNHHGFLNSQNIPPVPKKEEPQSLSFELHNSTLENAMSPNYNEDTGPGSTASSTGENLSMSARVHGKGLVGFPVQETRLRRPSAYLKLHECPTTGYRSLF
ncbi:uncharacterized protein [Amphiura filiformis]|uniref:uncharacterized protein n=1 Tax=Amphiura filiformis TaxID=82378 RepID=UPI003B226B26